MIDVTIFLSEFQHFVRRKFKVCSYIFFIGACLYSIQNGLSLYEKQVQTVQNIQTKQNEEIQQVVKWFKSGANGPEDREWVDIHEPYWALRYVPSYTIKEPSRLLPLGLGQSEQYGFYKEVTFWSSTYDSDMVAEIANPERLGNGTIDFSFLVIYCLPLLLIVLTYDVGGLEKDEGLERLIAAQYGSIKRWITIRFAFYVALLIVPVVGLISAVAYINGVGDFASECFRLILLSMGYVACFSLIYGGILSLGRGSSENAFNMIGVWVGLCILIPGAVHQYVSLQIPVSYMTDFLDANRKETYAVYSMPSERLQQDLGRLYPTLQQTHFSESADDNAQKIRQSLSALTNDLNKSAAQSIEERNTLKNDLLKSSYWFNPVMFVQNTWNSYTSSDYEAYYQFRRDVQQQIDQKIDLLVLDSWNDRKVQQLRFQEYIDTLQ